MSEYDVEVQSASRERRAQQRRQLAPFRFVVVAAVAAPTLSSQPSAGLSGRGLGITIALVVFAVSLLFWPTRRHHDPSDLRRVIELAVVGGAAVTLAFLQPNGASELPASAAVFVAGVALPAWWAFDYGLVVTGGLAVALATAPLASGETVVASVLLCGVLGVTGALLRRARESQDRTELLLAQLREARDDQARAAALDERAAIARELHDVLAHSLSGLSIQLEGARRLSAVDGASSELRASIDRAATLAKQGLVEARDAVGALRQDESVNIENLVDVVAHFRDDVGLRVEYATSGVARPVAADVAWTLHRVLGEALTNVVRHAPEATTHVELRWAPSTLYLRVDDDGAGDGAVAPTSEGGGWGLIGVRERLQRLGGDVEVGKNASGWTLEARVPA